MNQFCLTRGIHFIPLQRKRELVTIILPIHNLYSVELNKEIWLVISKIHAVSLFQPYLLECGIVVLKLNDQKIINCLHKLHTGNCYFNT